MISPRVGMIGMQIPSRATLMHQFSAKAAQGRGWSKLLCPIGTQDRRQAAKVIAATVAADIIVAHR